MDIFWKDLFLKWFSILLLSSFMPFAVFSFYRFRLPKKEKEYKEIMHKLKLEETGSLFSVREFKNEYSSVDYFLPVLFTTIICVLGFYIILFASTLPIDSEPSLLLGGKCFAAQKDYGHYQRVSFSAIMWGFVGAYLWSVQNILRRLVTIDITPGAYYDVSIRIIVASFFALVFRHLLGITDSAEIHTTKIVPVVAFLAGMFPERALFSIKERFKTFSEKAVKKADDLPLDMIEGINAFHRVRLAEVGIDNAQNLSSANLVELILKTPFKPVELIDWIGQAKLYLFFKSDLDKLRKVGIRTIFDFRNTGTIEGHLSEVAKATEVSPLHLKSVYQIIKDDPSIERLSKARRVLEGT